MMVSPAEVWHGGGSGHGALPLVDELSRQTELGTAAGRPRSLPLSVQRGRIQGSTERHRRGPGAVSRRRRKRLVRQRCAALPFCSRVVAAALREGHLEVGGAPRCTGWASKGASRRTPQPAGPGGACLVEAPPHPQQGLRQGVSGHTCRRGRTAGSARGLGWPIKSAQFLEAAGGGVGKAWA